MLGVVTVVLKHSVTTKTLLTEARSIHRTMQKYFKHNRNIFPAALTIQTFLTRCTRLSDGVMRPAHFLKSRELSQSSSVRRQQMSQLDVNMNVQNNVILYKCEKDRYFRNIHIFAIGQLFGWFVMAYYTYTPTFFEIFTTDTKFKEYIKQIGFRLIMCTTAIITGPLMYSFVYALCARNVKYVILNKGGETVSIITYHMWKRKSNINVPVKMVKCIRHRTDAGVYIPLRIKNRSFHYLIDKQGTFINPKLFDHTMG